MTTYTRKEESEKEIRSEIISKIYTNLSSLDVEIKKRVSNQELRERQLEILKKSGCPKKILDRVVDGTPTAVYSRYIVTPNLETKYFMDVAAELKFRPLFLEYDGLCSLKNKDHYFLCKNVGISTNGEILHSKPLTELDSVYGKKLSEIICNDGTRLKDYHRNLCVGKDLEVNEELVAEITDWFNAARMSPQGYYFAYLSLFMTNFVLCENFLGEAQNDWDFFHGKVLPSFESARLVFGEKPLILPLLPISIEKHRFWYQYRI